MLNHEYDGIREYDNPIPAWWNWIFLGSFVFSVFYFVHYHMGNGVSVKDAYAVEMEAIEKVRAEEALAAAKNVSEEKLAGLMADPAAVAAGEAKFKTVCVACHGQKGEGLIGPNLTDAYWLHGDGSLMAIRDVVINGVVEKGMVAWGKTMPPDELNKVVAYVGTLRGKNEPGKEPQGEKHEVATN
ncbi:MAG: c-type cytochrome [Deltaproteobacteria bacterium]|nr:c-type cytochrome [Deltaproteobacteria bacterium]